MDIFTVSVTGTKVASSTVIWGRGFWNFEEKLDQNQYNLANLKQFGFRLYPFLEECYRVDKFNIILV